MVDHLLDEHEQSERVRGWLRQNGAGLIAGIALGLAVIGGWNWWQQHQAGQRAQMGQQYASVVAALGANDVKKASAEYAKFAKQDSDYAALAGMQLARAQVDAGDRDAAIATLRGVQSKDAAIMSVVRSRTARLLLDAGKAQEALALLGDKPEGAAAIEARGDALYALGKIEEARAAYAQALVKLDVATPARRLVELKLIQVGGTPAGPEARS
ncbi:tetratricopeptide repeat protein [Lysobacter sp. A6]|uniref:Ancillary SecYEG translocon subunit n=1 Tax=Noviluteimonas lactosilytica TaxID=2888523 RepID=A0ABS8JD15_9GAMM|nr:tetratricopeptide repeat protein [Lysobacter lactosilyticus]MCC8361496.1 tetratricopeptide repeat protein [Lysobacter lactosilyticus]